jgi:hypothetical protein
MHDKRLVENSVAPLDRWLCGGTADRLRQGF